MQRILHLYACQNFVDICRVCIIQTAIHSGLEGIAILNLHVGVDWGFDDLSIAARQVRIFRVSDTLISFVTSARIKHEALSKVAGVNTVPAIRMGDHNRFVILQRERDRYRLVVVHGVAVTVCDLKRDLLVNHVAPAEVGRERVFEGFIHIVGCEIPDHRPRPVVAFITVIDDVPSEA